MVPLTKIPNFDFLPNHPYPLRYHPRPAAEVGLFTELLCTRFRPPHGQPQVTTRLFIVFLISLFAAFVYYASRTLHSIIFPDSSCPANGPCLSSHTVTTPPSKLSPANVCKAPDSAWLKKFQIILFYFSSSCPLAMMAYATYKYMG